MFKFSFQWESRVYGSEEEIINEFGEPNRPKEDSRPMGERSAKWVHYFEIRFIKYWFATKWKFKHALSCD